MLVLVSLVEHLATPEDTDKSQGDLFFQNTVKHGRVIKC